MDSLKWSEQLRRDEVRPGGRRNQGLCPVCRKPLVSKEVGVTSNSRATTGGLVGLEIKKIPRKQFETRKERDAFFEGVQEKGKQRAKTEDVVDVDSGAVKGEHEAVGDEKVKPLMDKRKRKREAGTARSSVSGDSLFGSP